jgi:DUF1680 family protein
VYCIEQDDQPAGTIVDDLRIDQGAPLREVVARQPVPGTVAVKARGTHVPAPQWGRSWAGVQSPDGEAAEEIELTAIPYAHWGNRSECPMRVWIPTRS